MKCTNLKVLLTVYFSILFLILLYDPFYYEKCHYLALTGGGRLCGGGAIRSVNIQRKVLFPLAPPPIFSTLPPRPQCPQPCPPPKLCKTFLRLWLSLIKLPEVAKSRLSNKICMCTTILHIYTLTCAIIIAENNIRCVTNHKPYLDK